MSFYNYRDSYWHEDESRLQPRSAIERKWRRFKKRRHGWTYVKIALALGIVSLILQLLGFSCPGWLILTVDLPTLGGTIGAGLFGFGKVMTYAAVWYVRVCIQGNSTDSCSTEYNHEPSFMGLQLSDAFSDIANINWTVIKVETTLAVAICMLGIIFCVISLCEPCAAVSPRRWAILTAGLMLGSCVLLLPAIIHMSEALDNTHSAVNTANEAVGEQFITVDFPWAMALTGAGMVLAFICCVLLIVAACRHRQRHSGVYMYGSYGNLSDSRFPHMISTRFSNYSPMPGSPLYYKDQSRLKPSDSRDTEFLDKHSEHMRVRNTDPPNRRPESTDVRAIEYSDKAPDNTRVLATDFPDKYSENMRIRTTDFPDNFPENNPEHMKVMKARSADFPDNLPENHPEHMQIMRARAAGFPENYREHSITQMKVRATGFPDRYPERYPQALTVRDTDIPRHFPGNFPMNVWVRSLCPYVMYAPPITYRVGEEPFHSQPLYEEFGIRRGPQITEI